MKIAAALTLMISITFLATGCNRSQSKAAKSEQGSTGAKAQTNQKKTDESKPEIPKVSNTPPSEEPRSANSSEKRLRPKRARRTDESAVVRDRNNLKYMMIAMHHFTDEHNGIFPPAVVYGPDGKPWHSWRVLILPYLGAKEKQLYDRYDLAKPWDSDENKQLLAQMPDIFKDPLGENGDGMTCYAALVGSEGGLIAHQDVVIQIADGKAKLPEFKQGPAGRSTRAFEDGLMTSIIAGRTADPNGIPWTSPTDIAFQDAKAGLDFANGFEAGHFAFVAGNVHVLKGDLDPRQFQALLTCAGNDSIAEELEFMITGSKPKKKEREQEPEKSSEQETVLECNAAVLQKEFLADRRAAEEKYQNKIILVSVKFVSREAAQFQTYSMKVACETDQKGMEVFGYFRPEHEQELVTLKKGDAIALQGKFGGANAVRKNNRVQFILLECTISKSPAQ